MKAGPSRRVWPSRTATYTNEDYSTRPWNGPVSQSLSQLFMRTCEQMLLGCADCEGNRVAGRYSVHSGAKKWSGRAWLRGHTPRAWAGAPGGPRTRTEETGRETAPVTAEAGAEHDGRPRKLRSQKRVIIKSQNVWCDCASCGSPERLGGAKQPAAPVWSQREGQRGPREGHGPRGGGTARGQRGFLGGMWPKGGGTARAPGRDREGTVRFLGGTWPKGRRDSEGSWEGEQGNSKGSREGRGPQAGRTVRAPRRDSKGTMRALGGTASGQ